MFCNLLNVLCTHLGVFCLQLFKMDIEGFEAVAIKGSMQVNFVDFFLVIADAMQLLQHHRVSNVLVEIKSDNDRFPFQIPNLPLVFDLLVQGKHCNSNEENWVSCRKVQLTFIHVVI